MSRGKCLLILLSMALLTCGIDQYYYLPQIPEGNINTILNTEAEVRIPAISASYAINYSIYYKIYTTEHNGYIDIKSDNLSNINSNLYSDYRYLDTYTNPSTAAIASITSLFTNRNFYKLELDEDDIDKILPTKGGLLTIIFPTQEGEYPYADFDDKKLMLLNRAKNLVSPVPNKYFRNTQELKDPANITSNINADVAVTTANNSWSYVLMYIVAVGIDNNFSPLNSKPTYISIFKLP